MPERSRSTPILRWLAWIAILVAAFATPAVAQTTMQSITGVVRDTSGAALEGALVTVGRRQARTNAAGAFRLDSVPIGHHPLDVRLIGYLTSRMVVPVIATEATELEFFLVPTPALMPTIAVESRRTGIRGLVGDTSYRAIEGARVQLLGPGGREVVTDSMGRFDFSEIERGQFLVRVTFPGYTERRVMVELARGEGREYAVLLTPTTEPTTMRTETAIRDLDRRLAWSRRQHLLTASELARAGRRPLCEVASIRSEVRGETTTLILNGEIVLRDWPLSSLCLWPAEELDLVEFGRDICADDTRTLAEQVGIWCTGRTRAVPRSINPGASSGLPGARSYLVVWERR